MRFFVIIAGVIHALAPEADRLLRRNETEPIRHPLIDDLDLTAAAKVAATRKRPEPTPVTAIYVAGHWIERNIA